MNHCSGMEMAKQRQAGFQREADLRRQVQITKTGTPERTAHFPRLLGFRRAPGSDAEPSCTRGELRLIRSRSF